MAPQAGAAGAALTAPGPADASGAAARHARPRGPDPRVAPPAAEVDDGVRDPVEAAGRPVFAGDVRGVAAEAAASRCPCGRLGLLMIVEQPGLPEGDLQGHVADGEPAGDVGSHESGIGRAPMTAVTGHAHVIDVHTAPGVAGAAPG